MRNSKVSLQNVSCVSCVSRFGSCGGRMRAGPYRPSVAKAALPPYVWDPQDTLRCPQGPLPCASQRSRFLRYASEVLREDLGRTDGTIFTTTFAKRLSARISLPVSDVRCTCARLRRSVVLCPNLSQRSSGADGGTEHEARMPYTPSLLSPVCTQMGEKE